MSDRPSDEPRVAVFAPSPVLVCTFEYPHDDSDPEVALNVGGQGPWVARAVSALGTRAILVVPLGGDTGRAAGHLLSEAPHDTQVVATTAAIGCYLEERRHGERTCIREAPAGRFGEREIDDLYSAALTAGLESDVCVITGSPWPDHVDRTLLTRLTADLDRLGRITVVDLSGDQLDAALAGGADWVKISHEELQDIHGVAGGESSLWEAAEELARSTGSTGAGAGGDDEEAAEGTEAGAGGGRRRSIVVSGTGNVPTLVVTGDTRYRVTAPRMTTVDSRGSGDAMTAALAAGLAAHDPIEDVLRRATAAGAANAVHKGSATPDRHLVDRLTGTVEIEVV